MQIETIRILDHCKTHNQPKYGSHPQQSPQNSMYKVVQIQEFLVGYTFQFQLLKVNYSYKRTLESFKVVPDLPAYVQKCFIF